MSVKPKPHEQFRAFERTPCREALHAPFTCEHSTDKTVFAVDSCGNQRIFPEKTWLFKEVETRKQKELLS